MGSPSLTDAFDDQRLFIPYRSQVLRSGIADDPGTGGLPSDLLASGVGEEGVANGQ